MKLLVLAVLTVSCFADPSELNHPSPTNPSVLIEAKSQDKVILISGVNGIAKYKRETNIVLHPTLLPGIKFHHITKRDYKHVHENKLVQNTKQPEPQKLSHIPSQTQRPILERASSAVGQSKTKRSRRDLQMTSDVDEHQQPKSLLVAAPEQHKRDIPVPLVAKHKHPEISETVDVEEDLKDKSDEHKHSSNKEPKHRADEEIQVEDLPRLNSTNKLLNVVHTPQLPHGHELQSHQPQVITDDSKHSLNNTDTITANDYVPESPTEHPVIRPKPVPVAELFARHHDN